MSVIALPQPNTIDTSAPVHQIGGMRLTVSLDPDIDPVVRSLAKERNTSISAALNELVRRALMPNRQEERARPDDLPVVRGRRPFSSEDVYSLDNESS